jgi:hypothetical protein
MCFYNSLYRGAGLVRLAAQTVPHYSGLIRIKIAATSDPGDRRLTLHGVRRTRIPDRRIYELIAGLGHCRRTSQCQNIIDQTCARLSCAAAHSTGGGVSTKIT